MTSAGPSSVWSDRVLIALARVPDLVGRTVLTVTEEVAIRFAAEFVAEDRDYDPTTARPRWHGRVRDAVARLRDDGAVTTGGGAVELTDRGTDAVDQARERLDQARERLDQTSIHGSEQAEAGSSPLLVPGVIAAPLRDPEVRERIGFARDKDLPVPVMAELNLRYRRSVAAAFARAESLWNRVSNGESPPTRVAGEYLVGELSVNQLECLVAADAVPAEWPDRSIFHVWPDFTVRRHVDASFRTIKADAARRTFEAYGEGIVWAVVDTGIDGTHPHFTTAQTLCDPSVSELHRYFTTAAPPTSDGALVDPDGHGTHVAGIIAGQVQPWLDEHPGRTVYATESRYNAKNHTAPLQAPRAVKTQNLAGMAPLARLVSLRALGGGGARDDRVNRVIQALSYVRDVNGDSTESMRIHGVNLSVGYEFDPQWFGCGLSPLCKEVDKLVNSGVVVVVAAGNSGYGKLAVAMEAPNNFSLGMTINDPGNAARAITVGSTHRSNPQDYGVSYFSSKGPTGDGREKPELVAPGELITSCAAGANLTAAVGSQIPADTAVYAQDSGTSMAAPHVSGAIAALLSVRQPLIGKPDAVKKIVVDTARSLHRRQEFQGAGLLDLLAAVDDS